MDLHDFVEEILSSTYFSLKGEKQDGGNFRPNDETVQALHKIFDNLSEMAEFLRLCIATHVWMTDSGKNIERVPFFVNKHLLAPKRIELVEQYASMVRSKYGNKLEHVRGFTSDVFGDVLQVEGDYLYTASAAYMHGDVMQLEYIRPTLYWVLVSSLLGRFKGLKKRRGCPEIFCNEVVQHRGVKMFFEEAWAAEVAQLRGSERHEEVFMNHACNAMEAVRHDWAVKTGILQFYRDDFGEPCYKNLSGVDMSLFEVGSGNLKELDESLFSFAKKWLSDKGTKFEKPSGVVQIVRDETEEKVMRDGIRALSSKNLNPVLASIMTDDE